MTTLIQANGPRLRKMKLRDFAQLRAIEDDSSSHPWTLTQFLHHLRQPDSVKVVAEHRNLVVGNMVYTVHDHQIDLLNFTVHPQFRRQGVGRRMAETLFGKLSHGRRTRITLPIRETNLAGQLFWRAMGMKAVGVVRGMYEDTGEAGYEMEYRLAGAWEGGGV